MLIKVNVKQQLNGEPVVAVEVTIHNSGKYKLYGYTDQEGNVEFDV